MYLTIAQSLSVFDISPAIDSTTGQEIKNKPAFTGGTISHPLPFGMTIKPRSKEAEDLVKNIAKIYTQQEGDSQYLDGISPAAM